MNVDDFVNSKVLPQYRDIVALIRQYMSDLALDAQEMMSYGILTFKRNYIFALISPTKKDIILAFSHGAEFEDKYAMLKGEGVVSKHLKFKKVDEVNKEVL